MVVEALGGPLGELAARAVSTLADSDQLDYSVQVLAQEVDVVRYVLLSIQLLSN